MPTLDVPYYVQPTGTTCQGTCLKMLAAYLDEFEGRPVGWRDAEEIKKTINSGTGRPAREHNSHANMLWWLETQFPNFSFRRDSTTDPEIAATTVKASIDNKFPVIVSTNHERVEGHIILAVGYKVQVGSNMWMDHAMQATAETIQFICHDPYGRFNPALRSELHGGKRWTGGSSTTRGEIGPGQGLALNISGIRRLRRDQHSYHTFFMIRPAGYLSSER